MSACSTEAGEGPEVRGGGNRRLDQPGVGDAGIADLLQGLAEIILGKGTDGDAGTLDAVDHGRLDTDSRRDLLVFVTARIVVDDLVD